MKSVNRKVLLTLLGVVLAAPFLIIAMVVGIRAAAFADNVRAEVFCLALLFAGVAMRFADGHFALTSQSARSQRGYGEPKHNTDLQAASTIGPGY